jgi:hypothetical protein
MENWLSSGKLDHALTCGVLGELMVAASGVKLGKTEEYLKEKKAYQHLEEAKKLLAKYPGKIRLPTDFAVDDGGKRKEITSGQLPSPHSIMDIGHKTAKQYGEIISKAATVMVNGPAGVYEKGEFSYGTKTLLGAVEESRAFSVLGGGHTLSALDKFKIDKGESADVLEKVKNKHDYYLVNEKEEIDIAFIHGYTDPEIYIYLCGGRLRTLELDLESQQQKLEFQNTLKRLGRSSISDDDIALLHTDISAKMHHIISVKSWLEGMRAQDPEAYKLYITDAAARVRGSNSIRDENRTLFSQPVLERIDLICSSVAPERVAEVIAKVQARLSGEKKKA